MQARKDFYDERLSRMKMEQVSEGRYAITLRQAEQDELVNLQQEIEKRLGALAGLRRRWLMGSSHLTCSKEEVPKKLNGLTFGA